MPASVAKRYALVWVATSLVALAAVVLLNWTIDPLWFHDGNRLTHVNRPYNERVSKLNLFLGHADEYDCVLFGGSVSTVLDTRRFADNACFNFSFSAGQPIEFVEYASYLRDLGFSPRTVYVEINHSLSPPTNYERSFPRIPENVLERTLPRYWLATYLSLDASFFSIKSLLRRAAYVQVYDQDFVGYLRSDVDLRYQPSVADVTRRTPRPPDMSALTEYRALRDVWPEARVVGYVHPISPWNVGRYVYGGHLETYLDVVESMTDFYDEVYDFTIPSAITEDTEATYDGSHFNRSVLTRIADVIEGRDSGFGVRVLPGGADYKSAYRDAIEDFLRRSGIEIPVDEGR